MTNTRIIEDNNHQITEELQQIVTSTGLSKQELIEILETLEYHKEKKKNNLKLDKKFSKNIRSKIEELSGESMKTVEGRLRPGRFSSEGFLGKKESLMRLLKDDYKKCLELNLDFQEIAEEVQGMVDCFRSWNKEYISGYGEKIAIRGFGTRGSQSNPFTEDRSPTSSLIIYISRNDEEIQLTEMHPWLIGELGFFQGKETSYRVDPEKFARIIGSI